MAPKIGMTNLWADGGILPVSGVTKWVISGNEGSFFSVCLVFSTGEKMVLIKYSGYRNIGNITSRYFPRYNSNDDFYKHRHFSHCSSLKILFLKRHSIISV